MDFVNLIANETEGGKGALLALGCFDGLHKGHMTLLYMAKEKAKELHVPFGVWSLLNAKGDAALLQKREQKLRILKDLGADFALFEDFNEIHDLSPKDFLKKYLISGLQVKGLVCGEDFRYGKNAEGSSSSLYEDAKQENIPVFIQEPVMEEGRVVSSALVRSALKDGKVKEATALLGRPFSLYGKVEHGRQVGRNLGFPTLNLPLYTDKMMKYGVYLVGVRHKEHLYPAIANVGVHPTFGEGKAVAEAHILLRGDFDLYSEPVEIEFYSFVREERHFTEVELLRVQVKKDIEEACRFFGL